MARRITEATGPKRERRSPAVGLLAGFDTLYWSSQARISMVVRTKLEHEKMKAQLAAKAGAVHCPDWLGARVLPSGARGYSIVVETDDFAVKIVGEHMTRWPGIYCELRSHFLHTHAGGERGAVEESLCWVRTQLLYDQDERDVLRLCDFGTVTPSRFDLHFDYQGGFAPTFATGEVERFVKPRRVKWHPYFEGTRCTGYRFGEGGHIVARLYNKSLQTRERHDEGYAALVTARNPETFDPTRDVWRVEFQVRREGMTTFRLAPTTDCSNELEVSDAQIEAELAAEDLPHVGSFPKLFAHRDALWRHLTMHWLRLVRPARGRIRSRWPLDPTWQIVRDDFARLADAAPLSEEEWALVRASRYAGRRRLLRRMALGVVKALEVEDSSVTSASLAALQRFAEQVALQESQQLEWRKSAAQHVSGAVPAWVERGMGAALDRPQRVRHLLQMLLGIFAAHGVLALEFKPAHSVGDLLTQHLDALEGEAEQKGGLGQVLAEHFAKVYKVAGPIETFVAN